MPARDLDQICEIAARLNEDAALLRKLGLKRAANLLAAAEADLDGRVYAMGSGQDILYGEIAGAKPTRLRRAKAREIRTH